MVLDSDEEIEGESSDCPSRVKNVGVEAVLGLVMGTVTASGIPEAIAAAVLVAVIGKVLLKVVERV